MSLNRKIGLVTGTATAAFAGLAFAGGNIPSNDTNARIQALEQQIAELKAQQSGNWLTDERAEEIRALVQEVVSDANGRTSLLANGGGAGYDNGFYISSDDGSFKLNLNALSQFRAVWNSRDNSGGDNSIFGFENSRTRLDFNGNLFGNDFTYRIQGDFMYSGGGFTLLDAWGRYQVNDNMGVSWGQFKAPFLREELLYEGNLQTVDRSYVHALTTAGYTQGVQVDYSANDNLRFMAAFTDGTTLSVTGPNGSLANSAALASGGTEYAFTGRAEWLVAGEQGFSQFDDLSSWSDDQYGTLLGGAVHWQDGEYGTTATETQAFMWTVDCQTEFGGANIFASFTGTHTDTNSPSATDVDQYGAVVQGGAFLDPDRIEVFGRWEWYDFDDALASARDNEINIFTAGVNVYWQGHDKKWTTDLVYANDGIPASAGNLGLLADAAGEDGQIALRSQVQFHF